MASTLLTVGHGTLAQEDFAGLLLTAGVEGLVDVRIAPGSRRHPHFSRDRMAGWVPAAGIAYEWRRDLGGFRKPRADSPNRALRNDSFRGYADYMATPEFVTALDEVLAEAGRRQMAVMCSEAVWWRCHRRLIADAVVVGRGGGVEHLMHDGRRQPHRPTDGVRRRGDGVVYDVGVTPPLLTGTDSPGAGQAPS
ncbi:MAG TPA: DUF488 domain-containing protein [Acidimicrobiales bacterium]|nr:DUF488 domain-containing protein [Acidimicrobiales bacterium]